MLMGHKNNRAKVLDTNNPVSLEKDIGTPQVWDPISGRVREAKELFSPRTIVLTNIGSVKGKFRYFVVFALKKEGKNFPNTASPKFKRIARDSFGGEVEVEKVEIYERVALATVLIPPIFAPADYIDSVMTSIGEGELPFYNHFLISNTKKPSRGMVIKYLRDLDTGMFDKVLA